MSKRLLQIAVAIAGLVPVLAGLTGAADPALLNLAADAPSATHAAYLSGLLLGIGLGFWSLIPRIEREGRVFDYRRVSAFIDSRRKDSRVPRR